MSASRSRYQQPQQPSKRRDSGSGTKRISNGSATKTSKARSTTSRPSSGVSTKKTDKFSDDGILFTNVTEKKPEQEGKTLTEEEILLTTGESEYKDVYEICLRCMKLGAVPNLEKFKKLRILDLSANSIRRIANIELCAEIRDLKIYDNQLEAIEKLDNLSELTSLQVQHNRIRTVARGLVTARKLQSLRLDSNLICKIELKEFAAMSKLTQLDLSNNKIEDLSPLNCLPNLAELSARGNRVRTLDLNRCKKVEDIDLSGNRITDLSCFSSHSHTLKNLNLSKNNISKIDVALPLRVVEELDISYNTIKRLAKFAQCFPAVQILDIRHNSIHDASELRYLRDCSELRELSFQKNIQEEQTVPETPRSRAQDVTSILPRIQVVDGIVLIKSSGGSAPLMRPMSASNLISSRHVLSHMDQMTADIKNFQAKIEDQFRSIRISMDQLPVEAPDSARSNRPASRANRRSRIMEAKMFADNHFTDEPTIEEL